MHSVIAGLAGLMFGLGLLLSGMGNPGKVQDFLDVFGRWDPSLGVVMGGAIGVGLVAFAWARQRRSTLLGEPLQLPSRSAVDGPLLGGAALFGVGWGLAGFCPGPAVMSLSTGQPSVLWFVGAMLVGMGVQHALRRKD